MGTFVWRGARSSGFSRMMAISVVAALAALLLVPAASFAALVDPTYPEVCPPSCVGGLVLTDLREGEAEYGIPGLSGATIRVEFEEGDGWWLSFDSDVPVVRVVIRSDEAQSPCKVFEYGTNQLVFQDTDLAGMDMLEFASVEFCFAGGRIVVHKYEDLDRDGVYDDGEPMLENWHFTLTVEDDGVRTVGEGNTDADGELMFPSLEPSQHSGGNGNGSEVSINYIVTETLPAGWLSTTGGVTQENIEVEDGETTHVWFGNARTDGTPQPPEPEPEPAPEPEPEYTPVLPLTGADPLPLFGAAAAFASAGLALRRTSRRTKR